MHGILYNWGVHFFVFNCVQKVKRNIYTKEKLVKTNQTYHLWENNTLMGQDLLTFRNMLLQQMARASSVRMPNMQQHMNAWLANQMRLPIPMGGRMPTRFPNPMHGNAGNMAVGPRRPAILRQPSKIVQYPSKVIIDLLEKVRQKFVIYQYFLVD